MNKKINLFLLFYVLTAANVLAQRVSEHATMEKARQFMQDKTLNYSRFNETDGYQLEISELIPNIRMFDRVGGDQALPPINIEVCYNNDIPDRESTMWLGLALFDDHRMVNVLGEKEIGASIYNNSGRIKAVLDSDIQQGKYRIKAIYRTKKTDDWEIALESENVYIDVTVDATSVRLQPIPTPWFEQYKDITYHAMHTIDGITYNLITDTGRNKATVLHYNNDLKYEGDIFIPDYVEHHGEKFIVNDVEWHVFWYAPELTSLSICNNERFEIWDCPKLTKLEMREGGSEPIQASSCPLLESLTFPETCDVVYFPYYCDKLSSITIKSRERVTIERCEERFLSEELTPALKEIYLASTIPPVIGSWEAPKVNSDVTIHIPQGTLPAYQHSIFKDWNLVDDQPLPEEPVAVKWDYCGDVQFGPSRSGVFVARGDNDVEFAMRIPAEQLTAYKGCSITAIEFYSYLSKLNGKEVSEIEYVFVTSPGHDYLVKQPVNAVHDKWMKINLPEPYNITGEDLFVGVGRHGFLNYYWANKTTVEPDGFWLRYMGEDCRYSMTPGIWEQNAGCQGWDHPLPIRAIIEGEHLPNDVVIRNVEVVAEEEEASYAKAPKLSEAADDTQSMAVVPEEDYNFCLERKSNGRYYVPELKTKAKVKSRAAAYNSGTKLQFKLVNRSPRLVENVILDWTIDGKKQEPLAIETALSTNQEEIISVPLLYDTKYYNHELNMEVTSIDGEPDEIPSNSSSSLEYTSLAQHYPRKIVMEEGTGTWCGWCPRGIETIKYMKEHYPENFITIAVHCSDQLSVRDGSYSTFDALANSYGVPFALLNRIDTINPLPFAIDDLKDNAIAAIKAEVRSVDVNKVTIATETEFGFNDYGTEFRIAYVVTEDNVGPYAQCNFYSGSPYNPNDLMCWWSQQASYVEMQYNEVARGIYDYNGVSGLLPTIVKMGEKYNSEYTLTLPDNVQNAHNANIVTLLLDTRSGEIMNADCVPLAEFIPDGIQDILHETDTNQDIYSITGVKIGSMTDTQKKNLKGIYIRKGKKVLVK